MRVKLRVIDFEIPEYDKSVFDELLWASRLLYQCEAQGSDHNFQIVIAGPRLYVSAYWLDENGRSQASILADGKSDKGGFDTLHERISDALREVGIVTAEG